MDKLFIYQLFRLLVFLSLLVSNQGASPSFSSQSDTITLPENTAVSSSVYTAVATDTNPLTYAFNPSNTQFSIDNTGVIQLSQPLDYELTKVYDLIITATDSTSATATMTLTVTVTDVNDNAPTCTRTVVYKSVDENTLTGTPVYTLTCSDGDSSNNDNNVIVFSLTNVYFDIDSAEIKVQSPPNYEVSKQETLYIIVKDNPASGTQLSTTVTVIVSITPLNDVSPIWSAPFPKNYNIQENSAVGTTLFTASATDGDIDVGGALTYSLLSTTEVTSTTSTPVMSKFIMDSNTGDVITLVNLDRDTGVEKYIFGVQVTDGGSGTHVLSSTVTVTIDGVNDNVPVFVPGSYYKVIQETDAIANYVVGTVSAKDDDLGTVTSFTYNVNSVIVGNLLVSDWSLSTNGDLILSKTYDLDVVGTSSLIILQLIVTDGGGSLVLTGTASFTISIIADNEYTPTIQSQTTSPIAILENTAVGTSIAKFTGADQDIGAEGSLAFHLALTNTGVCASNPFSIDSTGTISIASDLDRETCAAYSLLIEIKDTGVSPKTFTGSLSVSVTDVNDHQPSCPVLFLVVSLSETAAVNDLVTTMSCSDMDSGDTLTYVVLTNSDTFGFTTDKMKLIKTIDYDSSIQNYDVDVKVTDGTYYQIVKVRVMLKHENEFTPAFSTNQIVSVQENSLPNSPLLTYTATDADYSPDNIVAYEIQSVTPTSSSFSIDSSSGNIFLKTSLDYEALPAASKLYSLQIIAKDGGGKIGTGTVTIFVTDVNESPPTCLKYSYLLSIPENQSPITIVNNLNCNDPDGTTLTYSLTSSSGSAFSISGPDTVILNSNLDYETLSSYTVTINVADGGSPSLTATVVIYVSVVNVNEGGPTFTASIANVLVDEDVAVSTSVAAEIATDPDGSDPKFGDLRYSIVSGDVASQFYIDSNTGIVSTRSALDFEKHQLYTLVIKAKENLGANSASMTLTISINDLNDELPTCTFQTFSAKVLENKPAGFTVTTLVCSDADASPALNYIITNGDTSLFQMSSNVLQLKASLDFETIQIHNLEITVSDSVIAHNFRVTGTVNVGSIDEGPPVFQNVPYSVQVIESTSVPSIIFTVSAKDPDSPLDANGQVKYSFLTIYPYFSIGQFNGQITLVQVLDRETTASHSLIVKAEDATSAVTSTITVTVLDSNDNTPIFTQNSYSTSKTEPVAASTTLVTVTATDADDPNTNNYGKVAYSLMGSSDFIINSLDGSITNVNSLTAGTYALYVTATDSGGLAGARTGSTVVTITVTSVNGHDPICSSSTSVTIKENDFLIGDIIAYQTITDADSGINGQVTMAFETPQTKFSLTQNGMVGEIRMLQNLDFDAGDTLFNFNIKVVDKGSPARSTTCTQTIKVDDVNDNPPICTIIVNVQQPEGQKSIATLSCSDIDANSMLYYTVISTTPSLISPLVSSTGVVFVATYLDYEIGTSYQILIKVDDSGTPVRSTTVTINLHVTDINDNDPTLSGTFAFTVPESMTASGTVLYTASASSNDGPTDALTYWLSDTTYFGVSPANGEITLTTNAPDYETVGTSYTMNLCVKDSPNPTSRTACHAMTITITDVNDNSPIFSPSVYSQTLAETAAVGATLLNVAAKDLDGTAAFNTVTYSIFSGNIGGVWSIDSSNGEIKVASGLDYETTTFYDLIIMASDGTKSATVTCNIQIGPVNEYDPTFSSSSVTLTVNENLAYGTSIYTVAATEQDHGDDGKIVYSIGSGPFEIDSSSGKIIVSGILDRETVQTYSLSVLAIDQGSTPRTGTLSLTVSITDVNDNSPTCVPNSYAAQLPESAIGGIIIYLACSDLDFDPNNLNNALTYSIATGDTTLFTVDNSGFVQTNVGATFDRETTSSYTLTINIVDKAATGKLTGTATVSITITDVNDNAPVITALPSPSVPEDKSAGSTIATVIATDADIGVNKELVYSITNGNSASKFFIDPSAGIITLLASLDYETVTSYSLEITVTDKGTPLRSVTGLMTVTVTDVNDLPPVCASTLYTATVAENSKSTPVVTVSCPDTETVGTVTYSITSGDTGSDFSINSATGAITTSTSANTDYETKQSYMLKVTAFDGVKSATTFIEVTITDVNEADPQFNPAGPYTVTVYENETVGFTVKTVSATDADIFDTVKIYSITAGDTTSKFMMDSVSGVIKLQGLLDHETTPTYTLTIKVTDSGGKFSTTTLTINVGDVNDNSPVCQPTSAAVSVDEGISSGTLFTPTCSDADTVATPSLKYSILSGGTNSFSIDTSTGAITLVSSLDYETASYHSLVLEVSDQGTPTTRTSTVNVIVNVNPVNEFSPVFTSATYGPYSVAENVALDLMIAQVTANDADEGFLQGTVRYLIIAGDAQQQFAIDQSTGKIKVVKNLDREAISTYALTVRALDDDPASPNQKRADAVVQVDITDVNDNVPIFNPTLYTVDVLESANYGPAVILKTFTVRDDDVGVNAVMTITMVSGNSENKFSISGTNLILSAQLDYETTRSYELVLKVSDSGTPSLNSAGRVLINVLPANDMAPLMANSSASVTIPENTSVGTLVYDADATDIDTGVDGQITYSIASGVANNEFIIDSSTGKLYVGSMLDYDTTPNTYSIILKATDGAGASDASTSTTSLSITLSDVNDNYPQYTLTMFIFSLNENVAIGTTVGTVVANDKDVGINGVVTLSKVTGSGVNYFDIDSNGIVTTIANIDYEAFSAFYFTVKAKDSGTPSLTSIGLVKININNMNDNNPDIIPVDFAVIVPEDVIVGTTVMAYVASDKDTSIDFFSLSAANSFFKINSATGEITTKVALDRETTTSYVLHITVKDLTTSNDPSLHTSTATLTVIVSDVNDNPPVITGTYTPSVAEDSAINTLVMTIVATDADANQNSQLVYSITAGNAGNAFKIDSAGRVQVATSLDRETTASYTLTILVSDKGTPVLSDQANVIITITDVNDNDPVFSLTAYTFNANENSVVGTSVGTVVATDADSGVNAALTYSFDSYTLGASSHLTISGSTGKIAVAVAALDRETTPTYIVKVKVTDSGSPLSRTAYAQVTIYINDLNDNAPVFTSSLYSDSVIENCDTTISIVKVTATDADINANAALTYSINTVVLDGLSANTYLKMDPTTGVITPKTNINYETIQNFTFVVTATDGGSPALSGTSTVYISVIDLNDNSPIFNPLFYNAEVAYSGQCQNVITTVTATDSDAGNNGVISYSLQTAAFNYLFIINFNTGQVSLNGVASANTRYLLDIQASDGGSPIKMATAAAKVRVDTFVPNNQVVTFRLQISRTSFLSMAATFLANLQTVVRNKYPSALVRLWCIQEYNGVAQLPPSGRRRLLADQPVDVLYYSLKDNNTNSLSNVDNAKSYLTQDEFLALVAANPQGDPGSSIQGSAWDSYRIVSVNPYYEPSESWWDTDYGIIITVFACLLGLVLLCLITYLIFRCCWGKGWNKRKKLTNRVAEVKPVEQPPTERVLDYTWQPKTPPDDDGGQPYRKAFPPILITDPLTPPHSISRSASSSDNRSLKGPRSLFITTNDDPSPPYSVHNRSFNGRAMDHVTGKMYEYNTTTNERRWIE